MPSCSSGCIAKEQYHCISINVVRTIIDYPFGNGLNPTYKNGDLGDGLSMLIIVLTTLPSGYVKIAIEHDHL